jgi:uncharacterized protein YjbJ (UPF0337 family)
MLKSRKQELEGKLRETKGSTKQELGEATDDPQLESEGEIRRVVKGRVIFIPLSPETHGHQSHTYAGLWKNYLMELLAATVIADVREKHTI